MDEIKQRALSYETLPEQPKPCPPHEFVYTGTEIDVYDGMEYEIRQCIKCQATYKYNDLITPMTPVGMF
jgi:hypothetical protein